MISYRQALHDTLRAELQRDENVILLGEEIGVFEGSYKITAGLLAEFGPRPGPRHPDREEGFVGAAIGAAMLGLRPVVEIMTINFSLLAIDQIVNHAAKMHAMFGGQVSVPLVIRTPGGGGQQLAATHSQNLEVWYAHVPGMKVVAPATPADAKALLAAAIRDDDPVLFLENLALYNTKGEVPDGDQVGEIGTRRRGQARHATSPSSATPGPRSSPWRWPHGSRRTGSRSRSSTCAACGRWTARRSAPRSARPAAPSSSRTTGSATESAPRSPRRSRKGAFDYLDAPVRRVAAAEVPLPYAKPLELAALPDAADLSKVILEVLDATRFTR